MRNVPGHGKRLSYYHFGTTPFFASQYDQRFSYCAYVPHDYDEDGDHEYPLVVLMHGTERGAHRYRDEFAEFCERHRCIALAPLFPVGIGTPGELDNYKFIEYEGIRFDRVLLAMVDEVARTWRVRAERFLLHGFSGGGHFAHRFLYLHPRRLAAVSVGAPGVVTLLDTEADFWVGVRDLEQRFGTGLDLDAVRAVAVQLVIGAEDTATWEITIRPDGPRWMPGADRQGANRQDRMRALRDSLERHRVKVRHDVVPGVEHDGIAVLDPVREFFAEVLRSDG
ncbi:hydrolase [Pseudonocardia acaciae]|uniref:hydrolase n=1 Tax=Pseudonocardia acaciae TaxID=551276 RepID=UPI000490D398|nr:hydrolase [Pseudonocardia acaciae]